MKDNREIGVTSGTSMDGIDFAMLTTNQIAHRAGIHPGARGGAAIAGRFCVTTEESFRKRRPR